MLEKKYGNQNVLRLHVRFNARNIIICFKKKKDVEHVAYDDAMLKSLMQVSQQY